MKYNYFFMMLLILNLEAKKCKYSIYRFQKHSLCNFKFLYLYEICLILKQRSIRYGELLPTSLTTVKKEDHGLQWGNTATTKTVTMITRRTFQHTVKTTYFGPCIYTVEPKCIKYWCQLCICSLKNKFIVNTFRMLN